MQTLTLTFDSLPSAVGLLLKKVENVEAAINKIAAEKKEYETTANGKRIATAAQLAKYLRRPISAVYQMVHRGDVQPLRMPGSRKLYFDLDAIDATLTKSINP